MSSINSLLNHGPQPEQRRSSQSSSSPDQTFVKPPTTYEAADALTTLATLGSGQQYAPAPAPASTRELPSPTTFTHAPRRTSSFGSYIAPVEPSPPIEQPTAHSPTLDQYHHSSKSPEEQRRQSLQSRSSPAPILAPIQSLTSALQEHVRDEPQQLPSTYGTDVSQTVPPPGRSNDEGDAGRDSTQNREPAFVRDEPTTSQIREPESIETTPHPIAQLPPPLADIKDEPVGTPREATPSTAVVQSSEPQPTGTADKVDVDEETLKTIEALKQNDLGLRTKRNANAAETVASPVESKAAPAPSKKRPAPASSAIKKKGTAALKKPSSKKRKLDPEPDSKARSETPTSRVAKQATSKSGKKGSQAGTPAAESSPAPEHSSPVHASEDEGESSDDNTLYCICRKPDNHRWMIGCDGGCDDWFHGSCVNMVQSQEELVDKFICPNCEAAGRGKTTWKPMCRREGCKQPARLAKGKLSKYCSDECGKLFMKEQLQRTAGAKKPPKKSKKKITKDEQAQDRVSDEEEEPTPLGGVIRAQDLKALALASKDIETFKRLGSGVLSPPHTASPTKENFNGVTNGVADDLPFTPSEREHLRALHTEKETLKVQLEVFKDRENFVSMAREQAARYAEKEKIKIKEFCGYDYRLAWSDHEFYRWRESKFGRAAFKFNTLAPTAEQIASLDADGDIQMNGDVQTNGVSPEKDTVCIKKRCPKHPHWQKTNLQDARFEELEIVDAIHACEKTEREVRERARRRIQKDVMEAEMMGGEKNEERNREGWAQVVEA